MIPHRSYLQTLAEYASLSGESLRKGIPALLTKQNLKIVVLDDDPTGIQTVHGCLLLTDWTPESLEKAFIDDAPLFYLLTNTRSMTAEAAAQVTADAVRAVVECNRKQGFRLLFISRSDSTLRGHFPLEPDTIRRVLREEEFCLLNPTFFIPAFFEAGRFTVEGIHYLKDKDDLIPVAETEFANDNVFGYKHSRLSDYIREKTQTETLTGQLTLEDLRRSTTEEIQESIRNQQDKQWITVDALGYDDLWKFSAALLGFFADTCVTAVLRTSSSLPKALSGLPEKALLERRELIAHKGPGLFVVGSHVKKSSLQLSLLLESSKVQGFELDVRRILSEPDRLMDDVQQGMLAACKKKRTPVLFTSREELRFSDATERLETGRKISDFLVRIVQELPYEPTFLVAKGGITSHDILTKGLSIRTARVAGQILAGVPVVKTEADHRFPKLSYIIFPGNVGDADALKQVLDMLG